MRKPEIWRDLGIVLMGQGCINKLDIIEVNNSGNVTQCCSAILKLWRQIQPGANWNQLIRALKQVKLNFLAITIEKSLLPSTMQRSTSASDQLQAKQPNEEKQEDHHMQKMAKGILHIYVCVRVCVYICT